MKQFLLCLAAILFINIAQAQTSTNRDWMSPFDKKEATEQIQVFPNPAVSHISLTSVEGIKEVAVYNLVGRKIKTFTNISIDKKLYIGDLTKGIYLIQIINRQNKIVTTRRVSKK
ncbi:MAG: T9SS type A sorting domain-containing protein [Saprospiraceae bacterium]|nr:T9SS type A sorting domain-containing protein [Saprospiraceae bacterium]